MSNKPTSHPRAHRRTNRWERQCDGMRHVAGSERSDRLAKRAGLWWLLGRRSSAGAVDEAITEAHEIGNGGEVCL